VNENTDNVIPIAEHVAPDSKAALAKALGGNAAGDASMTRDVIDVYQSYLQTMWNPIARTLGPVVTVCVFRSIVLHDDRLKQLCRDLDITERGISLRHLEGKLGRAGSAERVSELGVLLPQLCNALDSLACHILGGSPDHNSGGDAEPIGKQ